MRATVVFGLALGLVTVSGASARAAATVYTRTDDVAAVVAARGAVWVATRGGVERYDASGLGRERLFTTADGLAANDVRELRADGGSLIARTPDAICFLADAGARFACAPAPRLPVPAPTVAPTFAGHRTTARLALDDGRVLVGTSHGLWLDGASPRLLTPTGACSNHVMGFAEHAGAVWLGTFDQGLCRWDGAGFTTVATPFRMVNDLVSTPRGLYVAAGEGLFVTRDGRTFARVSKAPELAYNDLAFDGRSLYATTPSVLRRLPLVAGAPRARAWWQPGGSRSLQAVAVGGGRVWVASEDRGVLVVGEREVTTLDRAAGLPTSWVIDVAALADGSAAIATLRHGLLRVTASGAVTPLAAPDPWLLHVSSDPDGRALWVGGQGGAARLASPDANAVAIARLPDPNVHAILSRPGELWVGTEGGTLVVTGPR